MLTIQVILPADNLQQAQSEAAGIIGTLKLKNNPSHSAAANCATA